MQPEVLKLYGVKDLEAALKQFDKDGKKALDKAINKAANTVKVGAKTYIKDETIPGLSRWKDAARYTVRTQKESVANVRTFPRYDAASMKAGLRTKKQRGKNFDSRGFSTAVAVEQRSPAGNIFEKGGIEGAKGGWFGSAGNNSINPFASIQFKAKLQSFYMITRGRGRALIRAGREDAGKANAAISRAQYLAELSLQNKFNQEAAKNG
jgi:hypothetical protein